MYQVVINFFPLKQLHIYFYETQWLRVGGNHDWLWRVIIAMQSARYLVLDMPSRYQLNQMSNDYK